ncbi:S8 family serine peptidase [Microbacterium esteraromaticum]|uniref:S8 family serine peptidase n=1 Tax=Microbacterium esteraromaticum TaxID=57043 RepID=UPI001A8DE7B9|nr:S8 family serine peptidase [Microbacterium esteraromaticum]MBN8423860.1 S8 family serine peptidase [Microbacterium esteraromaticum]
MSPRPHTRRHIGAAAVAATAMIGTMLVPSSAFAAQPDASDVLTATTSDQRHALAASVRLERPEEIRIADGVDLESAEVADFVVVLRQPAPATARALAKIDGEKLSAADAKRAVAASQKRLRAHAQGNGIKVVRSYDQAINAVVVRAKGTDVRALLASSDVASVWPNQTFTVDLPEADAEVGITGGGATYDEVAALRAEGIDGDGIKVGVLDTGIDYRHPALADAYRGGYDAVDDDDDPMETTYDDWKGSGRPEKVRGATYYTSHGTHVAGIIAGQDKSFGGRSAYGVAPDVDLYAYRVLGPYGGGTTEDILEGMEHALADGMDIVNMSLGGSYNDHRSPLSIAADNLTLAGVTTVIAAGNDGEGGAATLGSPGSSALALTVGANDSPLTLATTEATVGSAVAGLRVIAQKRDDASVTDLAGRTVALVDVGDGKPAGYSGKDVKGKIVLIQRGAITFNDMVANARNRGAVGAIVVNNRAEGPIDVYLGENDGYVPTFGTTADAGEAVRGALVDGVGEVTFGEFDTVTTEADRLAGFSSRGPANGTTDIKPEITAPGVSVMSTVPTWDVDPKADIPYSEAYGRKSGTSMATPFVAGLAALMLQADSELSPADIKTRLMNTADDLRDDSGVFESGAGQVDPRQAVASTVDVQVIDELWMPAQRGVKAIDDITGALSLGMAPATAKSTISRTIEVTNHGSRTQTYELSYDTAHGAGTGDIVASGIRVDVPSSVKVGAGKTKKVTVTVEVPAGVEDGTYGAFVLVTVPDDDEPLRLPLGLRVDDAEISDFTMIKPVMTTVADSYDPAAKFSLGVATPSRTLDLFLVDADSGADIGYVGGIDPSLMKDGLRYGPFAWYGDYLPLTGDKDFPISHKIATVAPGLHTLRAVGSDDNGAEFSRTVDFYVDVTAPQFTAAYETDSVHEFTQGQSSFPLTGSLVDGDVETIRAAGIDIDQSDSSIQLFSAQIMPYKSIAPAADGGFSTDIGLLPSAVQSHRFLGVDAAGNIGGRIQTMWFKDTQAYVLGDADKTSARVGDTVTMSFTTHNASDFGEMRFEAYFQPRDTTNIRPVAQDAFADYGRIAGEMTVTETSSGVSKLSVPIVFDGPKEYTGDDLPLIDMVFEVADTVAAETTGFATVSTYVKTTGGAGVQMQRAFDQVAAVAPTGLASGGFFAQGLLTDAGAPDRDLDHSTVGAEATLTASDGTTRSMTIGASGSVEAGGVPLRDQPWRMTITLPGHFTWYQPLALSTKDSDGGLAGRTATFTASMVAGDVNGDDVVDILDAIAIRDARGTDVRAADVDFSGTVDADDLAYVEMNYLVRNPTADTVPTPKSKHKGITLDEVLASFAD